MADHGAAYTDRDLLYSATARCRCGAGLAHPLDHEQARGISAWVCSRVLKGEAPVETAGERIPPMFGLPEAPASHDVFPFAMWKIREETSINSLPSAPTTRPPGTVARTVGRATCGACGHTWESEPYAAPGRPHHWYAGACPGCGNDCGGGATWRSDDPRPRIDVRFRDVVLEQPAESSPAPCPV